MLLCTLSTIADENSRELPTKLAVEPDSCSASVECRMLLKRLPQAIMMMVITTWLHLAHTDKHLQLHDGDHNHSHQNSRQISDRALHNQRQQLMNWDLCPTWRPPLNQGCTVRPYFPILPYIRYA
eukprot:241316-Chlamydomonas_euryale.AAC.4